LDINKKEPPPKCKIKKMGMSWKICHTERSRMFEKYVVRRNFWRVLF
jgi:hypothetical protein